MKKTISLLTFALIFILSSHSNAQWQLSLTPIGGYTSWGLAKKHTVVLAGVSNGIYFSDNTGTTWTLKNDSFNYVRNIVIKDSIIFITSDYDGVFKSLDNGVTWQSINSGISNPTQVWSLTHNDTLLILGTSGSFSGDTAAIYISSDNGTVWTKVFSLGIYDVFYSFAVSGNEVFVGVLPSGLFYSNDKVLTWTLQNGIISAKHIALSDTNLLCGVTGGSGGTYLSTDKGASWVNVLPLYYGYAYATTANYTLAGTSNGFYYSTDNGYTWTNDNIGLPPITGVISICVKDSFIFIGTDDAEIYKRNIADIGTGINEWSPFSTDLLVFPNPAANTLNIENNFTQPIQFILYNSLGKIFIDKILNSQSNAINLSGYSNGIYFYKLKSDQKIIKSGKLIKQ